MMVQAEALTNGVAVGSTIRLTQPLSLWGGTDGSGRIVDPHHPQYGEVLVGRVLLLEPGRGSSSSSSALAEQIRSGAAPAAIVLARADGILVLGAIVAAELYGLAVPILVVDPHRHAAIPGDLVVRIRASSTGGTITW